MSDAIELLPTAFAAFTDRVFAVGHDDWDARTPATEWSVRDLVNHMTSEHLWAPELLAGSTIEEIGDRFSGDVLGEDPKGAWVRAHSASQAAWASTPEDKPVHLSFGTVPASEYAEQMLLDLTVHGWDLARGTGGDERLPADAVAHVLGYVRERADEIARSGAFSPPVPTDASDEQTQLLALLGRRA
ncbi:MAG TPA: TIGR03086 family metal-binding protein [Actinomycetales bacterium]|nr:TIGR03086 family metal-binding protein [Actinomycetales bacterium]